MISKYPIKVNICHLKARHVGIIMDGNRRWAKRKGKLHIFGHKAGVKSIHRAINFAINKKLEVLTLYAFSSENWNRSITEVSSLMELFLHSLNNGLKILHKNNIQLRIIGDISRFNKNLKNYIIYSEHLTRNNNGLILNIAANYGGRWDITQGVQKIAKQVQSGILHPNQINENLLNKFICMNDLVPVDLVIRTGGEHRISNFLLWQIAYSEFYFTDILWPDFDKHVFEDALKVFKKRERRFGGTTSIISTSLAPRRNIC